MSDIVYYVISGILVLGVLTGIYLMSKVKSSVKGNSISAVSMALAIITVLIKYEVFGVNKLAFVFAGILIGSVAGAFIAKKVKMIQMPQTVALLNGFGGGASAIVGAITIASNGFEEVTSVLAVVVGVVTLVGSLIAASKLQGLISPRPKVYKGHKFITTATLILSIACCVAAPFLKGAASYALLAAAVVFSGLFGYFFSIRVGGADMPITISLLNSFSGVAGSIAGLAIGDALLVAVGGIVGASGLILTQIMCRAMNRHLFDILLGKTSAPSAQAPKAAPEKKEEKPAEPEKKAALTPAQEAAEVLGSAKNVIIIPGYGMALGQAQSLVKQLSDKLEANGANVRFAIHPVAGRMPGHMNVLLCEVDVPYEKLFEMDAINGDFADCDAVVIVGANDVVNPAAREAEGTPIYGMPVLEADKAKHVVIFNYDLRPGYAGVENPLYTRESGVTLLLGDAKETLMSVMGEMANAPAEDSAPAAPAATEKKTPAEEAAGVLCNAKNVIIIPGYGMALGQAQSLVKQLSDKLEANGANVRFAIHPVAGRMPGHMNVLLCEVDVPYEKLFEMDAINGDFADCDAVVIVGANDVVNPAAREAEGTPIYGMPVLEADKAKHVVIFNYDLRPGYAGVENPLYTKESGVTLLLGDAKETLMSVMGEMSKAPAEAGAPAAPAAAEKKTPAEEAAAVLCNAKNVIIIPGYGMALGQAQSLVKQLSDKLEANGANVRFAIHPVAGRMPGHMNVLLCEVDVPYEKLYEMDAINGDFADCDVAIIVGANDVVNPAAREAEGTPIYGMPVLEADKAKHVVIFNYDLKPGYAGVENPLYTKESGVTLLLGDAKETLMSVMGEMANAPAEDSAPAAPAAVEKKAPADEAADVLRSAKNIIIIPGYGMALGQAQSLVKQLSDKLEAKGADVRFAIHPVAGRMPGHMNVLLCEVDVPYEKLYEMDAINGDFGDCDVAIIVGANDVVNPAAREAEGTPIYGMPVLEADKARHVVIFNYDTKPGYAGVDNPLYTKESGVTLLLGDAKETLMSVISKI